MRAKVKTTVIDTGQEYLLLVAKMNLKGILVNTSQVLKPNTQLMLELKLNEQEPILIKGYVHKISEETSSKKGMVIAFSNPSDESKRKIQRFIDDSKEISAESRLNTDEAEAEKKKSKWTIRKKKEKQGEEKQPVAKESKPDTSVKPVVQNKTMIVGEDDLPSMMLSSPDNRTELVVATMDEESLHAKNPGLSGSTRHVKIDAGASKKKVDRKPFRMTTIYKAFGFVVTVIILVLAAKPILTIMDKKFGKKITLPTFGTSPTTTAKTPQTAQSDTTTATSGTLDTVQVEDQGGFLKISLLGNGNYANNKISKLTDPNRIQIELLDIAEFKSPATTAVNNNPISKINISKGASGTIVDVLYTGKEPPNFEAKVYNNSMDIFIYR